MTVLWNTDIMGAASRCGIIFSCKVVTFISGVESLPKGNETPDGRVYFDISYPRHRNMSHVRAAT